MALNNITTADVVAVSWDRIGDGRATRIFARSAGAGFHTDLPLLVDAKSVVAAKIGLFAAATAACLVALGGRVWASLRQCCDVGGTRWGKPASAQPWHDRGAGDAIGSVAYLALLIYVLMAHVWVQGALSCQRGSAECLVAQSAFPRDCTQQTVPAFPFAILVMVLSGFNGALLGCRSCCVPCQDNVAPAQPAPAAMIPMAVVVQP